MKDTFQCPVNHCRKVYKNMFNLRRHLDVMHIGVYKHKCDICNKALTRKQYLKEHMYTHTGERPYQCQIEGCGMQFRQRSQYSIHKKEHESGKIEVPVKKIEAKSMTDQMPRLSWGDRVELPPLKATTEDVKIPGLVEMGII